MTTETIPETDTVEAMQQAQASVILSALDDFLRSAPAREVRLTRDPEGTFHVVLVDERESRGESLRDAAAQATTVLMIDSDGEMMR